MHAHPFSLARTAAACIVAAAVLVLAGPAGAQYGGGANLTVDPIEVEIDGEFGYFGTGCPSGATVEITIVGITGVLDTTVAVDDSSYAGVGVAMPDGVVAGTDYRVEATCDGIVNWTTITAVCNGGDLPTDGACPDGQTVGGQDPPATTTTTTPGQTGGSGGGDDSAGSDDGGTIQDGGTDPDLAVTGATFAERALQLGATLVAVGAIVVLVARRRDDDSLPTPSGPTAR